MGGKSSQCLCATCVEEGSRCGTALVDGAGLVMAAEGGGDREPEPEEWSSPGEG